MKLQIKYAGFWQRFGAYLLDYAILGFIRLILFVPVWFFFLYGYFSEIDYSNQHNFTSVVSQHSSDFYFSESIFAFIIFFIILFSVINIIGEWLYFALMESSTKQGTLGKIIIGIKVTDINGNRISFGRASGRFFGKYLSGLILCIGYIMAAFTEKKQALHDILANCLVVDKFYFDYIITNELNNQSPQTN